MKARRIICLLILALFGVSSVVNASAIVGLENFRRESTYSENAYSDVNSSSWYHSNVAATYEYGLMGGVGNNKFNPTGNITLAETITVASRIYDMYYGGTGDFIEISEGDQWFDVYVRYADANNITDQDDSNYNDPATRAQFAEILSKSIDSVDLEEINWVDEGAIPDVNMSDSCAEAVYMLYRAGVLSGSGSEGTFNPQSTITRAEAAAIITRIVDPTLRVSVELSGEY